MSGNNFNFQRFSLLCKQHFIHNTQLLLLSTVAYIGVVFIVLSVAQVSNQLQPHDMDIFHGFLIGFIAVFGVLYVGHAFPAFRSKESTMSYLMVPASVLEKFVFEFISRIGIMLVMLPLLYWVTFHLQGFFFTMFTTEEFVPIGIQYLIKVEVPDMDNLFLTYLVAISSILFAFVLAFTGAAMFTKQPLVKSLFSVAVIIVFYIAYSYFVIVYLGLENYRLPDTMFLIPLQEENALKLLSAGLILSTFIMLFVGYRKLKEREV